MTPLEIALLAGRLLGVSAALLLAPGLLLLTLLRVEAEWPERVAIAFALSYCWIFALSIALPVFGWNADAAALLTVLLLAALAGAVVRRRGRRRAAPSSSGCDLLLVSVVVASAAAAWVIESPFTGEEVLDLASISRFADGGAISFANTSLLPDARAVYLFQPYQLALGVIARWSGADPLVAFIKFRVFVVPLALIVLFSLVRRLAPARSDATAVFGVILLFVALDFQTWEMNSLFPLVRRGAAGAGLCVPVMLVLCLAATRQTEGSAGRRLQRVALATAPVMLVASLATHPLEMFTVLCFVTGMWVVVLARLDRDGDRRQALALMFLLVAAAGTYVAIQSRMVPYVAEYERDEKQERRVELARLARDPIAAVGQPSPGADLLTRTIPATSAPVFGLAALPIAALIAPAAAAMLAVGMVPLALMYATNAGFIVLTLSTSVETVRDVNAYFALLGLIALALALTAAAHIVLNAAGSPHGGLPRVVKRAFAVSAVAWLILVIGRSAARELGASAATGPGGVLATGAIAAVAAIVISWRARAPLLRRSPFPAGVAVLTACLAVPFALPEIGIGGVFAARQPVDVITRFQAARMAPSVLEWDRYYEQLRQTIAPALPVPRTVVDELRRRIPPRQVVLADPRYSCGLVVLIDAYCINPASIYGHYFQPAVGYFRGYVADRASESPHHPFFNATTSISDAERSLIQDYGVTYVLTDPLYGDLIGAKLAQVAEGARLEMALDGYQLYRVTASAARTPGR
jgi:hypothetical protein